MRNRRNTKQGKRSTLRGRSRLRFEQLEQRRLLAADLLLDINQLDNGSSFPRDLAEVDGKLFLAATNGNSGLEFFVSDGTAEGTTLVKDIVPGLGGSNPKRFTEFGSSAFFTARESTTSGNELWFTDGTESGTYMVRDIRSGPGGSEPQDLTVVGNKLFFTADDGIHGRELWMSDGSEAGTVLVKDIRPGTTNPSIKYLTESNGLVFFQARDETFGRELWRSDGTEAGTYMVRDIQIGHHSEPRDLTHFNGALYFRAYDGTSGLWKSDGTLAGTESVVSGLSFGVGGLTVANDKLFFTSHGGRDLWVSDGTAEGTEILLDRDSTSFSNEMRFLTSSGGTLFFSVNDGIHGWELWKSDGTAAGTALVKDIRPGTGGGSVSNLTDVNGTLFFAANDGLTGTEIWKSDGTEAGTVVVSDIRSGTGNADPKYLTEAGGKLFFLANDGLSFPGELWTTDGTTTSKLEINRKTRSSDAGSFTQLGDRVYFGAVDELGYELWSTDGTAAGTEMLKDILPGGGYSNPSDLIVVDDEIFFVADDGLNGRELWRTDGTEEGTQLVRDIAQGPTSSFPRHLTLLDGTIFFTADDAVRGRELWMSDGTEAGTVLVKDVAPGGAASSPQYLTPFKGELFFHANDGVHGLEVWKTDGTESGTTLVKDINPGSADSWPYLFTEVNGSLFFTADNGINGYELWKTDGTTSGTIMVADIQSGPGSAWPWGFRAFKDEVYFVADDGIHGYELWKSDGTAAGTVLVRDIRPGAEDSRMSFFTASGGQLLFSADDGTSGRELWKSDGTMDGTTLVVDLIPGIDASFPRGLIDMAGTLYFVASTPSTGLEIWSSDGTASGTQLIADINPGSGNSHPASLTNINGVLYFSADNGVTGLEPFTLDVLPLVQFSQSEYSVDESGAPVGLTIDIERSRITDISSELHVSMIGLTADGSGSENSDFESAPLILRFAPGETLKTITLPINQDSLVEGTEQLEIELIVKSGAAVADQPTAIVSIHDDDSAQFSVVDASNEEDSGAIAFTVVLSNPVDVPTSIDLSTIDGSATAVDNDYLPVLFTTIEFAAGVTSQTIDVTLLADHQFESEEIFFVQLDNLQSSSPRSLTVSSLPATGTIINDDAPLQFMISDVQVIEGDNATTQATFTVSLSSPSSAPVQIRYETLEGTAVASGQDADFTSVSNGQLIFEPGELTKAIVVDVLGDVQPELDEHFFVRIFDPSNGTLLDNEGKATIVNDDDDPILVAISDFGGPEGDDGTSEFTFSVSLSSPSSATVTVNYETQDLTASSTNANPDFVAIKNATLTFAPGQTTQEISVSISGDLAAEIDETFLVRLTSSTNSVIVDSEGLGIIENDDETPVFISIDGTRQAEGTGGLNSFAFDVSLSAPSTQEISVEFETIEGTAISNGGDADFVAIKKTTLTFPPGQTAATILVSVVGDDVSENDENFFVRLVNPQNAIISIGQATGTIENDDAAPIFVSINDVTQLEGDSGTTQFDFLVTLSAPSSEIITIDYETSDGSAIAGKKQDYHKHAGKLTFAPGEVSQTVTVDVNGDLLAEAHEQFSVILANPSNAILGDSQGLGLILDDDSAVPLGFGNTLSGHLSWSVWNDAQVIETSQTEERSPTENLRVMLLQAKPLLGNLGSASRSTSQRSLTAEHRFVEYDKYYEELGDLLPTELETQEAGNGLP